MFGVRVEGVAAVLLNARTQDGVSWRLVGLRRGEAEVAPRSGWIDFAIGAVPAPEMVDAMDLLVGLTHRI